MVYSSVKFCVLVFVSFFVVEAQWAVEDEGCRTPDRGVGTCVEIYSCKPIMDLLDTVSRPVPPRITSLLRKYQCGFSGRNPKVCCPNKPIRVESAAPAAPPQPPNVDRHRNVRLLPKNCGTLNTDDKIINGNKTELFEFPWMALLSYRTNRGPEFKCGATIISSRYILTAAHCITSLKSPLIGVRVGEHNIQTGRDCETTSGGERVCAPPHQDLAIEEIIPHPEYDVKRFSNDIGLLRVATPIDLSQEHIRPVCLPLDKTRNYNYTNRNCIVTGWGVTEKGRSSTELLKVRIPVVAQQECVNTYVNVTKINHRQMCAGGTREGDSCAGDSGGPLQVVAYLNEDTRVVQQGIVSFGPRDCGRMGLPGVYTKVAYYMDWILDNMRG